MLQLNTEGFSPTVRNTLEKVESFVCKMFYVDRDFIRSRSRVPANVQVRAAVFYILSSKCQMPVAMIAKIYRMDRTTVRYGLIKAKELEMEDVLSKAVDNLFTYSPFYSLKYRSVVDKNVDKLLIKSE